MAEARSGSQRKAVGRAPAGGKAPAKAAPAKTAGAKKTTAAGKAAPTKSGTAAKTGRAPAGKPAKRAPVKVQRYQIDDRCKTMSAEALTCRSWGHAPFRMAVPADERIAYREKGQRIVRFGCRNGCSRVRTIILERGSQKVVSDKTRYEDNKSYLVQTRGAGRVPRQHSRQAFFQVVEDDD